MPGCDHPVHLSGSAPFEIGCGQIFFYDVIESDAMSRSSVLSCVAEGGGEAKLPQSVTVSEFRKWLTAVTDSDVVYRNRSFASMCTIVKVADAVDDVLIDGWVHIAAEALRNHALSSVSGQIRRDVSDGLTLLSDQLRHRLLEAAAFDTLQLDRLLDFLPTGLHAAVLAAMITRDKGFQMPLASASCPALKALASLPASPPSLLALHVDEDRVTQNIGPEVWSCLAQALHHHSGLTSLTLCLSPSTATFSQSKLLPHIAMLTSLRYLDLQGCMTPEDSSAALRGTLQHLKQLHAFRLRLSEKLGTSSQKRPRDREARPRHCLTSMLSTAAALTSLHIHVDQWVSHKHRGCFMAAAPLRLPRLVQMTAIFGNSSNGAGEARAAESCSTDVKLAACFFSNLTAPLTSLTLGEVGLQAPTSIPAAAAVAAGRLLHSLAAFRQLRCLSAALPAVKSRRDGVRPALTAALPRLFASLRQLQSCSASATSSMLQRIVPLLTTTALTKLHLWATDAHAASADFFQHVSQLNLRDLSLHVHADPPTPFALAALTSHTHLTMLRLCGWRSICPDADWQALAAVTCLQALCLGGDAACDPGARVPPECTASLHALSALTSLTVVTPDGDDDVVGSGLTAEPLPALQELELALYEPFDNVRELARYVATLPALRRLKLALRHSESYADNHWLGDDDPERPEARFRAAEDCISSAAAAAGVELTIEAHVGAM